eukprot:1593371-Pyramimonas_sp.AAC.1
MGFAGDTSAWTAMPQFQETVRQVGKALGGRGEKGPSRQGRVHESGSLRRLTGSPSWLSPL